MISFVQGPISALAPDGAVVEVGGVGLDVQCTPTTLAGLRVGQTARLPTALIVREDSLTLYGFADEDERTVFQILQTASGVGPRLAQAMLAVHSPDALRAAVATEDYPTLTQVPGIGRKGAQRIVLELRERLGPPVAGGSTGTTPRQLPGPPWREQLHAALLGLGWSAREADDALVAVAGQAQAQIESGNSPDVAALLRSALRVLSSA